MWFAHSDVRNDFGKFETGKITEELRKDEKNLQVVYTTILESHLEFSTITKSSSEETMDQKFGMMHIKKRNTNKNINISAHHLPLPVINPPKTSHEFTDMWFDILRKRKEDLRHIVDSNINSFTFLTLYR